MSAPASVNIRTRQLVLEAAERLNYRPNSAARTLTTGRSENVGIVVPDMANPFFPGLVKGMQARAHEAGRLTFLADTDEDAEAELELVEQLSGQVGGMILCSPRMAADELIACAATVPVVLVNREVEGIASVNFDDPAGTSQSVSHLSALGHQRVAWVGGPAGSFSHLQRSRAMQDCTLAAGMDLVDLGSFGPRFESGLAAADLVVASGASAVVAYNDLLALGILSRLAARGIKVPEEMSVAGNDDIAFASMFSPTLTTVALSTERAGRMAVDMLAKVSRDPQSAGVLRQALPTCLLVRASTGVVPRSGPTASRR